LHVKSVSESSPKIEPAPNSNTEKEPTTGFHEPMTGAQASYLNTLSGEPRAIAPDLTKAETSKRIDALKARR
jgi:Protein of unknown function (DUF3072)